MKVEYTINEYRIKKQVLGVFLKARGAELFPMFRGVNQCIISPISLTYIQAMAMAAVENKQLKKQIMDIQMFDKVVPADPENGFHLEMKELLHDLNPDGLVSNLSVQNNLFYKKSNSSMETFLDFWELNYAPRVGPLNRRRKTSTLVCDDVNRWIFEQSHGIFIDIISEGDFYRCDDFLLLNCVYFSGEWELDFDKNHSGKKQLIYKSSFLDCTFFVLDYAGGRYGMTFAFMDDIDALLNLFQGSQPEFFNFIVDERLEPSSVKFTLPIGVFESESNFRNIMFSKDANDLSGIRFVTQKVYLKMTDEGTKMAAVTILSQSDLEIAEEKIIPANTNPTVLVIYDKVKRIIFFLGTNIDNSSKPRNN